MTFGKRKRERIKRHIIDNLTLCRLRGDKLDIEASMRDYAPKEASAEGGAFKRFVNGILNDLGNAARSYISKDFAAERDLADKALSEFIAEHKGCDFSISENPEEFRKYIDKKLFSRDREGLGKVSFALMFAIDERNRQYQRPEESLEVVSEILFDDHKALGRLYRAYKSNYMAIRSSWPDEFESGLGLGAGIGGAIATSLLPVTVTGLIAFVGYILNKRAANEAFKTMAPSDINATFAFSLTVIECALGISDSARKELIDELLERVDNVRADAEYGMYVEMRDIEENKKRIALCDAAIERLGFVLQI